MNIFDIIYPTFKFNKKEITLFESFAGVGSQLMAMKKLAKEKGFTLKPIGISEIDKYAIASYNAIHGEIKNFGSICDIQEIPQVDIFTYSFPCQDISLAGNRKGFAKGSGTRSGLLWEVERLLQNQSNIGKLPKVLLMENVKALANQTNTKDFHMWRNRLEELGYKNYWEILNAKDYGIPQNRERVFMVSILGEYSYQFPKPFPLKLKLKDMLEDEVDEKFYLSDKMLNYIYSFDKNNKTNGSGTYQVSKNNLKIDREVAVPITTREGNTRADSSNYVSDEIIQLNNPQHSNNKIYSSEGVSPTIKTNITGGNQQPFIKIPEATKKGYAEATNGDGVYINRPHQKRGVVQKDMIQMIKTGQDVGVVVNPLKGKTNNGWHFEQQVYDENGITRAVKAGGGSGNIPKVIINGLTKTEEKMITKEGNIKRYIDSEIVDEFEVGDCADISFPNGYNKGNRVFKGYSPTINGTTVNSFVIKTSLKIRKLTPLECWRLMGFSDRDFDKAQTVCSNSQLYKQAGNSIVVDVLHYIFKQLF